MWRRLTPLKVNRSKGSRPELCQSLVPAGKLAQAVSSALRVRFSFHLPWKNLVDLHAHQHTLGFYFSRVRRGYSRHCPLLLLYSYYQYLASMMFHFAFFPICHDPDCLLEQ